MFGYLKNDYGIVYTCMMSYLIQMSIFHKIPIKIELNSIENITTYIDINMSLNILT